MSGYFPTNAYEPVPEYDNNGYPVQQSPPQQSYGGAAWSQHTSYVGSQASPPYDDHEGLLKQQQQPSTPVIAQPMHRASLMYHPPVNHQLRHQYRKTKQFRRIFTRIMGRWLLSCLFAAAIVGIFIMYERMDVLDSDEKHMFNALYLGVSLLMALNMVASFKTMADLFRWKVLASTTYGGHSAKELDLILGLASYGTSTMLLRHWIRKPRYFFLLLFWIMLGIFAQVGLALLGLTFNHDSEGAQRTSPGLVNVTLLDSLHRDSDPQSNSMFFQQNYLAHLYGDMSYRLRENSEGQPIPDDVDPDLVDIVYVNATNEFKYYFKEYAWRPHGEQRWQRTNRHVTVTPKCTWSPIISGQTGGNGTVTVDLNGEGPVEHTWTETITGSGTTLYANPAINANETESRIIKAAYDIDPVQPTCGARCGITLVYRFIRDGEMLQDPLPSGDYFRCETTISTVSGAKQTLHHMADTLAIRLASAIGSSAIWILQPDYTLQYCSYNSASRWDDWQGLTGKDAQKVAEFNVGRYAIGAIAVTDSNNPRRQAPGQRPWEGVVLTVKWTMVWINLGLLLGGQLVIGLVTMVKANTVFCKDASFLSTARLLRPLVDRMGESGCAASGKEISDLFGNTHMRYGVRRDGGYNRLDILMDIPEKAGGKFRGVGFPRGYYE